MNVLIIDSESLTDPLWLNQIKQLKVIIEHEPTSTASKYHYVFFLACEEESLIGDLQQRMKNGWYAFLLAPKAASVIYTDAVFEVQKENAWASDVYKNAQDHGVDQSISNEFLDFKTYIARYQKVISL